MSLADLSQSGWIWLTVASVAMFVVSLIALHQVIIRLPVDYFSRRHPVRFNTPIGLMIFLAKNCLGILLLIAGIIMLFTPGQGLLSIIVAVSLLDFPGKHRLQRWLIARPRVLSSVNAWRARAGRAALEL